MVLASSQRYCSIARLHEVTSLAAIDIGSNALRMAVGCLRNGEVRVVHTARNPIRLGEDVFSTGRLSQKTINNAVRAIRDFSKAIELHGAEHTAAVATSAVREATNGRTLTDRLREKTGLTVDVIGGVEEARLVHLAVSSKLQLGKGEAMLVDIGGGSVEVALTCDGLLIDSRSHQLGTVRMLKMISDPSQGLDAFNGLVQQVAAETREWVISILGHNLIGSVIGTGGNVEAIGDLSGRRAGNDAISYANAGDVERTRAALDTLGFEGRRRELGLRPDRADVIYPATVILQALMNSVWAASLTIPRVGLREGLLADIAMRHSGPARLPRRALVTISSKVRGR